MLRAAHQPNGDFNGDQQWDCSDIDALTVAIAAASFDPSFDMNADGMINLADITSPQVGWLAVGGSHHPELTGGRPFLRGDANLDGSVDVADFNAWNGHKFTAAAAWCHGDFNADGAVDVADFNVWNSTKFSRSSDNLAAVPEPLGCWQWLGIGLAAWWLRADGKTVTTGQVMGETLP